MGKAKRRATKIRPKAVGDGILGRFRDNFRPESVSDVMSGVVVEWVGMDVRIKYGDLGQTILELCEPLTL